MLHVEQHTLVVSVIVPLTGKCGTVGLLVYRRIVLGAIVVNIGVSGSPIETELSLVFAVEKPIETNIHGFGLFGDNGIVDDSYFCTIVILDRRMGLRQNHFD